MTPLSVTKRKFFASLGHARHRRDIGLFPVEGARAVSEMLVSPRVHLQAIVGEDTWWATAPAAALNAECEKYSVSSKEIKQLSNLVTPPKVIAYFGIPQESMPAAVDCAGNLVVALDGIQDPGNMGTILRMADWWGIENVVCSTETVDWTNPKVVQSAMGALGRVKVFRTGHLAAFLKDAARNGLQVYGACLDGENVYEASLDGCGILVMGNEGNGVSPQVMEALTCRLTIPPFPPTRIHVESLNVATAAAVIIGQLRNCKKK